MDAVAACGLTKYYGGRVGVEDVSFTLRRGGILGYLGPNGSDKTTIIRLMPGFIGLLVVVLSSTVLALLAVGLPGLRCLLAMFLRSSPSQAA